MLQAVTTYIGARAGAQGRSRPQLQNKKINIFGQKIDVIRATINHTNFICT